LTIVSTDQNTSAQERPAPDRRGRVRHPFAFYLVCLILVAVIPPFIYAIMVLQRTNEAQERIFESLLRTSTGSVNRVVEREVTGMFSTLNFLATSEHLETSNFRALHAQAAKALEETDSHFLVVDRNFNQLLNTRVPFDTPLRKVSDVESATRAFERGERTVSGLFYGRTAQKWVFNVYLPVRLRNGETLLLTLTQNADSLAKAVNRDILSPGWSAAVLDEGGHVIVTSDMNSDATGKPFFLQVVPALRLGVGSVRNEGIDYQVVTEFSALTGWRMIAWAKASDVQAPAVSSLLWLMIGGAVFAVLAAVGAFMIARVLSRDVRQLARDARRLGMGERIPERRHVITELETVSTALSEAADARTKAESEVRFLMREVAHRSKNQLTVIQAMLNQSAGGTDSAADFADAFRKRVAGLARSTDLMIANAAQGVDLAELARNQLKPFVPEDASRVKIEGPTVRIDTQTSQTLGMALHELSTNATKYGAFANNTGRVELRWTIDEESLALTWREHGADIGPDDAAASRKGFGSLVLERMLGMALDARLQRTMHDDGIEWNVTIPVGKLRETPKADDFDEAG
jgi:two-component sensor histidine kinase